MAKGSYPALEVRGSGREELSYLRGQGRTLGGATPRLRSGAEVGRRHPVSEVRDGGREGTPHVRCPGGGLEELHRVRGQGRLGRATPHPEARSGSQEEKPHVQAAVAAQVQEDLEELSHVEGQEGWQ